MVKGSGRHLYTLTNRDTGETRQVRADNTSNAWRDLIPLASGKYTLDYDGHLVGYFRADGGLITQE